MQRYRHQRIFITGGSSGIGLAAARQLVRAGAHVLISARGRERLEAAVTEIRAGHPPGTIDSIPLDITDREQVETTAPLVLERLEGLDVLINNAGVVRPGRFLELPVESFDAQFDTNIHGTLHVTRALLPHFFAQGRGHICNVGSMLGFMGIFGYSAYAASKFAVTGFTECLRQELLPHGVGVSIVFPPDTDTPQLAEENRHKPPETQAITRRAGVLSADAVARSMLKGIAAGRYHILPGLGARLTWAIHRHFPRVMRWAIDHELRKGLRARRKSDARTATERPAYGRAGGPR